MVTLINLTKTIKLFVCLVIVAFATNVSAQSYQRRTYQTDLGDAIVKGVGNLFKKKDKSQKSEKTPKSKDKASTTKKTSAKQSKKSEDDVELIVSGDGSTKEQATLSALRSALEQTYGTFVSSNTKILNDKLIKDEIVSISTGNIKEYQYLNENEIEGKWYVTLKAIVSIGKLVQYVQSKGGETELAGATFAMNLELTRLREKNRAKAYYDFETQISMMKEQNCFFDYEIILGEPKAKGRDLIEVPFIIGCIANDNVQRIFQYIHDFSEKMSYTEPCGLTLESLFKFKLVDDIIEYPFYSYTEYVLNDENSHDLYIRRKFNKFIRIGSPARIIEEINFCGSKYFSTSHNIGDGVLPSSIKEKLSPNLLTNGHFGYTGYDKMAPSVNTQKYNAIICGKLYYTEQDIAKITKIRIEPVLKFKQGEIIIENRDYTGHCWYSVYDDEVDCIKRGFNYNIPEYKKKKIEKEKLIK